LKKLGLEQDYLKYIFMVVEVAEQQDYVLIAPNNANVADPNSGDFA